MNGIRHCRVCSWTNEFIVCTNCSLQFNSPLGGSDGSSGLRTLVPVLTGGAGRAAERSLAGSIQRALTSREGAGEHGRLGSKGVKVGRTLFKVH